MGDRQAPRPCSLRWRRPVAARQGRAWRPKGSRRAGEIRQMRFLPIIRPIILLRRRHVHGVMHPAMPGRRDSGSFSVAVVDHPAALEAEAWIDRAVLGSIIAIAGLIFTHQFAVAARPEQRAESGAVPPGEEKLQEAFHRRVKPVVARPKCHEPPQLAPSATRYPCCPARLAIAGSHGRNGILPSVAKR